MHGSFKPLYLQTRRKSIVTLSTSPMHLSLRVDRCSNGRIGRNIGSFSKQPNPSRAKRQQTNVIIHICNKPGGERSTRRRLRGGRTQIPAPVAGILRIHCPNSMQIPIPSLSKDSICDLHCIPEATTLFPRVLDHSGFRSSTERHNKQSRCHGPDCQVGH